MVCLSRCVLWEADTGLTSTLAKGCAGWWSATDDRQYKLCLQDPHGIVDVEIDITKLEQTWTASERQLCWNI